MRSQPTHKRRKPDSLPDPQRDLFTNLSGQDPGTALHAEGTAEGTNAISVKASQSSPQIKSEQGIERAVRFEREVGVEGVSSEGHSENWSLYRDLIANFLQSRRNRATRRAYKGDLQDFFSGHPSWGELKAFLDLDEKQLEQRIRDYRQHLEDRALSFITIDRRLNTIHSFLKFASAQGLSQGSGYRQLWKQLKREHALTQTGSGNSIQEEGGAEDGKSRNGKGSSGKSTSNKGGSQPTNQLNNVFLIRLMNAPDQTKRGMRDRAILRLLYHCALHRSELCQLNVGDYDAKKARLLIRGPDLISSGSSGSGSSASEHPQEDVTIPLNDATVQALNDYLQATKHGGAADHPLFLNFDLRSGDKLQRLTVDGVYYLIRRYGKKLNVPGLSSREIRHAAIRAALGAHSNNPYKVHEKLRHLSLGILESHLKP